MKESKYQAEIKKKIKEEFPGSIIMKTPSDEIQGLPDLVILYKDKWAALEVKDSAKAKHRPNQDHYVDVMNKMSFASFIYPENEEEVFDELQRAFKPAW